MHTADHTTGSDTEQRLITMNRRLSELLHRDPVELSRGAARSMEDRLWVWGIAGGKEVGKSTLINALAGGDVVDPGVRVGEGTSAPSAYLHVDDVEALRARTSPDAGVTITDCPVGPDSMRGLVLIDLPDFDSLFTGHVEHVRRIAGVLDGIIWVTTPKKVGDLRAVREMRRVLKSRTNFVYVVNKMDWLLAQSDGPLTPELERVTAALAKQVGTQSDGTDDTPSKPFLISAKHRSAESLLNEVSRCRGAMSVATMERVNGEWSAVVDRVLGDFNALRTLLTSAPTAEAAAANKRANLTYQSRRHAAAMLEHFAPREVLDRLDRYVGAEAVDRRIETVFSPDYCAGLASALHADRGLTGAWAGALFERRIAHWPLLGWIAWPIAMMAAGVRRLWSAVPTVAAAEIDVFRRDGLSLEDRVDGAIAGVRAELALVSPELHLDVPTADEVARDIRADVARAVEADREAVIAPYRDRRPTWLGRIMRALLPVVMLIWFPLVQPVASGVLSLGRVGLTLEFLAMVVGALSATNVLIGLGVSVLILAMLAAAVYSRAVRDAIEAADRLRSVAPSVATDSLVTFVARRIDKPITALRSELTDISERLERVASDGEFGR